MMTPPLKERQNSSDVRAVAQERTSYGVKEDIHAIEMEDDKRDLITREISKFRDTHKKLEEEKGKKEKEKQEIEKERREKEREREREKRDKEKEREREKEKERERERDRTKDRDRDRDRERDREREREKERERLRGISNDRMFRGGGDFQQMEE